MKRIKFGIGICALAGPALFGTTVRQVDAATSTVLANVNVASAPDDASAPASPLVPGAPLACMATSIAPKQSSTPIEVSRGNCAAGMAEVDGDYCPTLEQRCLRWLDPETKMRCAEFAPTSECQGRTTHKHFCMDRYEYPNAPGEKPVVMKTWYEAKTACQDQGKRLCNESEWTLACEGQEHLPYPYGYARNAEACNIDKPHPDPDEKALANPKTRDAEVARLDQRDASGFREACVSAYGVHDMTGNVDEWVVNESGHPYKSGLKGGYWGPVRDRCRPSTIAHNEEFSFYQIGFRCCGDTAAPSTGASFVRDTKEMRDTKDGVGSRQNPAPSVIAQPILAGS